MVTRFDELSRTHFIHLSGVTDSYIDHSSPLPSFTIPHTYASRKSSVPTPNQYAALLKRIEQLEQRDVARQQQIDALLLREETRERHLADLHLNVTTLRHQNSQLRTGRVTEGYQHLQLNGKLPLRPTDVDARAPTDHLYPLTSQDISQASRHKDHRSMTRDLARVYYTHYERLAGSISGKNNTVPISPTNQRFNHIVNLVHNRHQNKRKADLREDCMNVITDANKELRRKATKLLFSLPKVNHPGPTFQPPSQE